MGRIGVAGPKRDSAAGAYPVIRAADNCNTSIQQRENVRREYCSVGSLSDPLEHFNSNMLPNWEWEETSCPSSVSEEIALLWGGGVAGVAGCGGEESPGRRGRLVRLCG